MCFIPNLIKLYILSEKPLTNALTFPFCFDANIIMIIELNDIYSNSNVSRSMLSCCPVPNMQLKINEYKNKNLR